MSIPIPCNCMRKCQPNSVKVVTDSEKTQIDFCAHLSHTHTEAEHRGLVTIVNLFQYKIILRTDYLDSEVAKLTQICM